MTPPELADVQGLVRYGYGALTEATFLLLAVEDPRAAAAWLARAPVSDAAERPTAPDTALQVALTAAGLARLGVSAEVRAGFSAEFLSGMAGDEGRSRRLGDVGTSAPAAWAWGGPGREPDALVLLYARPGGMAALQAGVEADLARAGFRLLAALGTSNLDGVEPFGFTDGISQPALDWERSLPVGAGDRTAYWNLVELGEVLLGYPNAYGRYTGRPLLARSAAPAGALPLAEDVPDRLDLGRNGTYLVLRQLRQDVRGFWQFVDRRAGGHPEARRGLAEAMVGRRMDGEPLLPLAAAPLPGVGPDPDDDRRNRFTYDADPAGARCPLGAHVRRANPRTPDLPAAGGVADRLLRALGLKHGAPREDLVAAARFHRVLRRGREYGPGLSPEDALLPAPAGEPERGLHFVALGASLGRQFEFVQNAWVASPSFGGLEGEGDPLLGARGPPAPGCPAADAFSLAAGPSGARARLAGLPRFIDVRGGAYFFLPGIRALRQLARAAAEGGA